jgi:hypothetical protein
MNKKLSIALIFVFALTGAGWADTPLQETTLKRYTTYQTSLTEEDIMNSFVNEVGNYLRRYNSYGCYYLVDFKVYQDKDDQNRAWGTATKEKKYEWGTVYRITLSISNALLIVQFSNTIFATNGQSAREIVTTRADTVGGHEIRQHIVDMLTSMFSESEMVLKMHNKDKYSDESRLAFLNILRIVD